MKKMFQILLFSTFLSVAAKAQEAVLTPNEFEKLSPEQINAIYDGDDLRVVRDYLSYAVSQGRVDIVKSMFESRHVSYLVSPAISELPDSTFRDEVVLMMIRSDSPVTWNDTPNNPIVGTLYRRESKITEPFRTTIKKLLPHLSLDDGTVLYSRAARLKLANDLEAAMSRAGFTGNSSQATLPNKVEAQGRKVVPAVPVAVGSKQTEPLTEKEPAKKTGSFSVRLTGTLVAALLAAFIVFFFLFKKRL